MLPVLSLDGVLHLEVVKNAVTGADFCQFIEGLLPCMNEFPLPVKISPHMSQKWLRFGNNVGAHDFMKFTKKYHQQIKEESANIGRITVCAMSPPLLQMLAEYCRKTT